MDVFMTLGHQEWCIFDAVFFHWRNIKFQNKVNKQVHNKTLFMDEVKAL